MYHQVKQAITQTAVPLWQVKANIAQTHTQTSSWELALSLSQRHDTPQLVSATSKTFWQSDLYVTQKSPR